jgi:hypothetical protein
MQKQQLKASLLKEISDLKAARSERVIVTTTDPQGIIICVNNKFCVTSKYSCEELAGHDHCIINSGFHPKKFIRDLWMTRVRPAMSGLVKCKQGEMCITPVERRSLIVCGYAWHDYRNFSGHRKRLTNSEKN